MKQNDLDLEGRQWWHSFSKSDKSRSIGAKLLNQI